MSSEQRKVLEEIQRSKRLLKEGVAASIGMHTSTSNTSPLMSTATTAFQAQAPTGIGDIMMTPGMRSAMQVLAQANLSSFGYFVPQDSHFGNSILPVLPRMDPPTTAAATTPTQSTSSSVSSGAATANNTSSGNGQ